jgi:PAS domain S-box-containing protein
MPASETDGATLKQLREENAALRQREAELRLLAENANDIISRFTPDGRLLYLSPACKRILGHDLSDYPGASQYDFMHPDDVGPLREGLRALAASGQPTGVARFRARHRDGRYIWFESSARVLRDPQSGAITEVVTVARDITEQKRVEDALKGANETLESSVAERTAALRQSEAALHALVGRLQTIREEERGAVAREIHDELGEALTCVKMDLAWLQDQAALRAAAAEPLRKQIAATEQVADRMIQTVQRIASDLRPGVLDDLGLVAAVGWQARQFQQRTGLRCALRLPPDDVALDSARATAVFRIFQEALTNVARHARATAVEARLEVTPAELVLEVKDNGRGITAAESGSPKSLGLLGMRERVLPFGGSVRVRGEPGQGTTATVTIPAPGNGVPR